MPRLSTTSRADSRSSMHSDESAASKEQQQQRRHSEGSSHGPRVDDDDDEREDENEEEEGEQGQGTGLLSGVRKRERATSDTRSESHDGYRVTGTTTTTMARVRNWALMTRWRTVVLALVAIALVVLLAIFFHPPSPVSSQHQQQQSPSPWYGATVKAGLKPGVFDEAHGALAPNPLESGSKFGDVPFASVGKAKVDHRPTWAGGSKLAPVTRERTVLLVSLDGVKPEHVFSSGGQMPNMLEIAQRGTSAEFLKPVFPSLTFPNHFSILTGLHPESHGIVGNDFVDPTTGKDFWYTDPTRSWDPAWWQAEPIWATAEHAGVRSAVFMWPGPPVLRDGTRPSHWWAFEDHFSVRRKVDKIFEWLDLPDDERPRIIAAYAPEVDAAQHRTGLSSDATSRALASVDQLARLIHDEIAKRRLEDSVDVLFVSDHGMAETSNDRLVFLDDLLGTEDFAAVSSQEGWPSAGLRFKPGTDEGRVYRKLLEASQQPHSGFDVFTHDTMPERWHFTANSRIAPLYVVPRVGWSITNRDEFHVKFNGDYHPKANHGWDNDDPSMRAFFVASGPFARNVNRVLKGKPLPAFANLEIYELVASLLFIPPERRAPNNGTVGFWDQYL